MRKPTTEELLRIVESRKEELKVPRHSNEVHQFIQELGISEGKNRVRNRIVYKAYRLWGGKKTSKSFATEFGKYFQRELAGHDFYHYKLNLKAIELLNKVDNKLIKIGNTT